MKNLSKLQQKVDSYYKKLKKRSLKLKKLGYNVKVCHGSIKAYALPKKRLKINAVD